MKVNLKIWAHSDYWFCSLLGRENKSTQTYASSGQLYTNYVHAWLRQRYTRYSHARPQASCYYSSLELVSSFVRYRLPGLLKLLLCSESCHRLISPFLTGVVAASSNLRQEIDAKHTGELLIPNAVTSIRRTFFVVQARFSCKPNTQQQSWLLLHGPRSSGVSRRTSP